MAQTAVDIVVKVVGDQKLKRLDNSLKGTAANSVKASAGLDKSAKSVQNLGNKAKSATGGVESLVGKLAIAAAAFVTVQKAADLAGTAIRESVARDTAEKSLSLLARSYGEVADAQLLVERSAKKFGQSQTEATRAISTTYARLRPLGATLTEIESVYNGFNTAARLSGATAEESAGAFRQLTQALGSGALRGDEFNSIAEQAPLLLQAVSKETGVAVGALRDYAAEGKITSDVVVRALQRIEKEGAAGLAEALQTPEQAFKDLENAAEDLNVEVGRLLQPAVLQFVTALTQQMRQLTADIDKTRKAVEFLNEKLEFLSQIGDAVAGAFDRMGISFGDFVSNVVKNLPVIGAAVQMLEKLGLLRDNLAQAQDNSKGGRNFGEDYAAQEKALFAAAGGFSPYKESGGIADQFSGSAVSPKSKKGGSKGAGRESQVPELQRELELAKELEPLYGRIADAQLRGDEDTVIRLQGQQALIELKKEEADILASNAPNAEKQLQLELLGFEVRKQVLDTTYELKELEQSRKEAIEGVTGSIEDEIEVLQAKLNGNEDEIVQLQEIKKLKQQIADIDPNADTSGVAAMVQQRDALKDQVAQADELKSQYESLASGIAGEFTSAFKSIIDGSKDAGEAFGDMLKGMADQFLNMAMKILQDALTQQLMKLFGSLFGAGTGGGFGGVPGGRGPQFMGPAFAGGGYTGDGARSGGVDGQGGFPAILHPQETVVDHYDDARSAMTSSASTAAAFAESSEAMAAASNNYAYNSANNSYSNSSSSSSVNGGAGESTSYSNTIQLETNVINKVEYATVEEVNKKMQQSAKQAEAQVYRNMRNKSAVRSRVGV